MLIYSQIHHRIVQLFSEIEALLLDQKCNMGWVCQATQPCCCAKQAGEEREGRKPFSNGFSLYTSRCLHRMRLLYLTSIGQNK